MTRGELLDRTTDLLGDKTAATRALITPWVKQVLNDMLLKDVLSPMAEWSANMTPGQRDYSFPLDMRELTDIYIPSRLIWLQPQLDDVLFDQHVTENQLESTTSLTGPPTMYRILRQSDEKQVGSFRLWGTPTSADQMILHGQANFDAITDDANILMLKDEIAQVAIMGMYRVAARFDNLADVATASQAYAEGIRDARFKQFGRETRPYVGRFND